MALVILVDSEVKAPVRVVLRVRPAATTATTTTAARIAYSIAVTPRSSRCKEIRNSLTLRERTYI